MTSAETTTMFQTTKHAGPCKGDCYATYNPDNLSYAIIKNGAAQSHVSGPHAEEEALHRAQTVADWNKFDKTVVVEFKYNPKGGPDKRGAYERTARLSIDITPANRPKLKTIGEYLAPFGGVERVKDGDRFADVEVLSAVFCTHKNDAEHSDAAGGIFVHCGGEALISFTPNTVSRRQVYLVFDSHDYDVWQFRRGQLPEDERHCASSVLGPCPRKRLALVQSA